MRSVLDDDVLALVPVGAQAWNRFDISHFLAPGSPWQAHRSELEAAVAQTMCAVVRAVRERLGADPARWRWGALHQITMAHRLQRQSPWSDHAVGPDPVGGSPTTLNMALHAGPGPGRAGDDEVPCRVTTGQRSA